MRKIIKFSILLSCLSGLFLISCQQQQEVKQEVKIKKVREKKKERNLNVRHKKGIEHMADYQFEIRKTMDAKAPTYKKGYLFEEYNKAKVKTALAKSAKTLNPIFEERGPSNVPGRTRGIAIDPTDNKRWFAGTVGGGVWLTEDEGVTWKNLTDEQIPNLATSTIVISPQDKNTLYVGTGEPFGNLGNIGGSGVFKTTDGGATWQGLVLTSAFGNVGKMILNPNNKNNLVIGTEKGIYSTTDGGTTWAQTYASPGVVQDLDADPTDFNIQYGSVKDLGLVKSVDGGLTWNTIFDKNDYNASHSRFETSVSSADPNTVFMSVYTSGGNATTAVNTDLYISRNKGLTFVNLTPSTTADAANIITGQGWYDNVNIGHPYNANVFYVGGVAIFKVTVSGSNFSFTSIASGYDNAQINTGVHVDQHGLAYIKGANQEFRLIAANDGGIYSTAFSGDPGAIEGAWSATASGKNSTQFYGATKQNGADNYIAGAQDNGSWISNGNNADKNKDYQFILGGDGFEVIWHYDKPGNFLATSQNYGNIGRYINYSGAFSTFSEAGGSAAPFYAKLSSADNNPDVVFAITMTGVWRSTDFAGTWEKTPIVAGYTPTYSSALNVEVSIADPNVVWAGGAMREDGSVSLHVSEDNGQSFTKTNSFDNPKSDHSMNISGIGVSPTSRERAYALFSSQGAAKILKTEDLGNTWTDISGFSSNSRTGFPDVAVHSILEMPFDKDILWAGTDIGIFETTNGGSNWRLIDGFIPVAVYEMKIVNDQVIISSYGRGIWSATLSELSNYQLPAFLSLPTVTANQKSIRSLRSILNYNVTGDNVNRVKIFIDGVEQPEVTQDFSTGVNYQYETPDLSEGSHIFGIQLFDDSTNSQSLLKEHTFEVIDFEDPEQSIGIEEFKTTDVYHLNNGFKVDNIGATVSLSVLNNSEHPYQANKVYTTILKKPLIITASSKNLTYEDMAIVEPYTDNLEDLNSFYDFVIIEGSTDLQNWSTIDKYDSRRFQDWLDEYNKGNLANSNDALFKSQTVDLTSKGFSIGDEIVLRFSLHSDPAETSFGWAIKSIQGSVVSVEEVINDIRLFSVYPTVSSGDFTIFAKNTLGKSKVSLFDITGKSVYTTTVDFNNNQKQEISVNLNSGVYFMKVKGQDNKVATSKVIIE